MAHSVENAAPAAGGVTDADRLAVLRSYREEILAYLDQGRGARAIALMLDLDEEWGGRCKSLIVAFADRRAAADQSAPDALFQAKAELLLDAVERAALEEIFAVSDQDQPLGAEPPREGDRSDLMRRVLAKSLNGAAPVVSLSDVSFSYRSGRSAFSLGPIDLELRPGKVLAVVGGNGSGKTTLLRLIAGDLKATRGVVRYPGLAPQAERAAPDWIAVRKRIAHAPAKLEDSAARARSYMLMTGLAHGLPEHDAQRRLDALLHRYDLSTAAGARVSEFSTGNRVRFELARMLMAETPLIVLDEPLANLSGAMRELVLADLRSLASSVVAPRAVVISSHHVREVEAISDHVVVLEGGGVLDAGARGEMAADQERHVFRVAVDDTITVLRLAERLGVLSAASGTASCVLVFDQSMSAERLFAEISAANLKIRLFEDMTGGAEAAMLLHEVSQTQHTRATGAP